ncbi:MAG: hypothetical protein NWF11_06210 [Candidatus Bathyarchaeota archaeon]|nr:hypothetical protein [Candidatus Bathyarchaeota archaeon]
MDPADFYFFVSPLAVLVAVLALGVFYYARREERADAELEHIKMEFQSGMMDKKEFKEKKSTLMQNRVFAEELERLQILLDNESIDRQTYSRLKEIISQAQRNQTA